MPTFNFNPMYTHTHTHIYTEIERENMRNVPCPSSSNYRVKPLIT